METLAYLHLVLTYEAPTDATKDFTWESLRLFEWLKRQKLTTSARMYWLSLVIILCVLGMAGEALAQRTLQQGDRGSDVTSVQQRLQDLGFLYQSPDGVFGSATRSAVIQFQQDYGLTPDGVVGPDTEAALFGQVGQLPFYDTDSPLPTPPYPPPSFNNYQDSQFSSRSTGTTLLRRGNTGFAVRQLQQSLRDAGYNPGAVDGVFGSQTEQAVRRFQRANGLSDDGVAGRETLTALGLDSDSPGNSYVVVVPIRGNDTLSAVRRYVPKATPGESGRGRYVNAGAFSDRDSAESLSYRLRSYGLDARVAYRP